MWKARCLCRCRQHSRTVPGLPTGSCSYLAEHWAGTSMGCVWKLPDAWAAVAPLVEELRDDCIVGVVAENPRGPQKRPWHLDVDGLLWASGTQNCDHPCPIPPPLTVVKSFPRHSPGGRLERGRFWALSMPHILFRGNSRPREPAPEGLAVGCTAQAEPGFLIREVGVRSQAASFRGERERDSDLLETGAGPGASLEQGHAAWWQDQLGLWAAAR
ncbi:not available [Pontoporia blainvillei]|uniref:Not available n=1 Tax=Pontoporia blainvillei TaxID=48723 RepID=A0ABX0S6L3_PONBL|nr:not available [Pontoporia blainvillei]